MAGAKGKPKGDRPVLRYKAGPAARRILLDRGLAPETVGAVVGPASGPKWLALVGLDRALLESGLLLGAAGADRRRLLVGASAGAWRMAALASPDPRTTHQGLVDGYVGKVFPKKVTARQVSDAYVPMLAELFPDTSLARLLAHDHLDLAFHTVRVRRLLPTRPRFAFAAWLGAAAVTNAVSTVGLGAFVERVVFHSRPEGFRGKLRGRLEALPRPADSAAFRDVLMATASVPLALEPVRLGSRLGEDDFLDGGVTDYHLASRYLAPDDGRVVLFPHYQERIAPGWFDKHLRRRRPAARILDDVLQIHPDTAWLASLPGGGVPDRKDFYDLVDVPDERIRRWRQAVAMSETLGKALLDDLQSGRWSERLEPLAGT